MSALVAAVVAVTDRQSQEQLLAAEQMLKAPSRSTAELLQSQSERAVQVRAPGVLEEVALTLALAQLPASVVVVVEKEIQATKIHLLMEAAVAVKELDFKTALTEQQVKVSMVELLKVSSTTQELVVEELVQLEETLALLALLEMVELELLRSLTTLAGEPAVVEVFQMMVLVELEEAIMQVKVLEPARTILIELRPAVMQTLAVVAADLQPHQVDQAVQVKF